MKRIIITLLLCPLTIMAMENTLELGDDIASYNALVISVSLHDGRYHTTGDIHRFYTERGTRLHSSSVKQDKITVEASFYHYAEVELFETRKDDVTLSYSFFRNPILSSEGLTTLKSLSNLKLPLGEIYTDRLATAWTHDNGTQMDLLLTITAILKRHQKGTAAL